MKVLVIGATGMLGYSLFKNLTDRPELDVFGTVRNLDHKEIYFSDCINKLFFNVNVHKLHTVEKVIAELTPEVVINCIGLIKQHSISQQHIDGIKINSLFPHQLASISEKVGAKLIHFSTDCVFSGSKGNYCEEDAPDAIDLYGRTKLLGEVNYAPHLTIRTSIIGHELNSKVSLIDWFLSQNNLTKGFSKAIFSGLPTCEIATILAEKILSQSDLTGLYQLSVNPIDKYSLLKLVAKVYGKAIVIEESTDLVINRSLNSEKLRNKIGYDVPSWEKLVSKMNNDYVQRYQGLSCKN